MYEVSTPRGGGGRGYYGQPSGLGYAAAVAAILGPLVEGGAAIYGTTVQQKQAKSELRQRKVEFAGQQELQKQAIEAQKAQFSLAQRAAIQQAQINRAYTQRAMPFVVAAVGLAVLGLVSTAAVKSKRGRSR
jgi:multidrug efflux pump subunit AcrA (membrane-fusion protein)